MKLKNNNTCFIKKPRIVRKVHLNIISLIATSPTAALPLNNYRYNYLELYEYSCLGIGFN